MVKLWGGLTDDLRTYPGSMYSKNRLGRKRKRVYMKCPMPFDIQRLIIARYLFKLRNIQYYIGKKTDLEFEKKVDSVYKRNSARLERLIKPRRREGKEHLIKKKGMYRSIQEELKTAKSIKEMNAIMIDKAYLEHGKYNFEELLHKSVRPFTSLDQRLEISKGIYPKQILERKNWLKSFRKDMSSEVANEIFSNFRMTSLEGNAFQIQHKFITYMEYTRYALKDHRWSDVCLGLCGTAKEIAANPTILLKHGIRDVRTGCALPALWIFGFLSIINHIKDDVSMVILFAKRVQKLFSRIFPGVMGSHLAVWLIQKGYFMEAYEMITNDFNLDEFDPERPRRPGEHYLVVDNPRRDQANFIYELIKATHSYFCWKTKQTGIQNIRESPNSGMDDELRRSGEYSLTCYEKLYTTQKITGADLMIFLEPFIELLVEYRSAVRARDVLLEMWMQNDGNMYFEKFFLDFFDKHPDVYTEIPDYRNKMKENIDSKYTCNVDAEVTYIGRRKISRLRKRRKKEGIVSTFQKISNPKFSV